MFYRNILKELEKWKQRPDWRPLIIRGARQTGKTSVVNMFSNQFSNFISLNLERGSDCVLFEKSADISDVIRAIEVARGVSPLRPDTLLFIDEIQNSEKALKLLRFFYEDHPGLHVIGAGSLLEAVMKKEGFSFPIGRVEFLYLYPATFDEFLRATADERLMEELSGVSLHEKPLGVLHKLATDAFTHYAFIGGMPACVADFANNKSYSSVSDIKADLITAIKDDVAKYSKMADSKYVRHVIEYAPFHVGERITYEKFGQSEFHSREMKRAFETVEYAMIVQRVYGAPTTVIPCEPNFAVSPKIVYLDSGLVVERLGIGREMISKGDLSAVFQGKLSEQVVGQALLAKGVRKRILPTFWYRNAPGSTAEIDYSLQHNGMVFPVEVKAGKSGSLKSLHQFMQASKADVAIRIYSGEVSVEKVDIPGMRPFCLLSIPFYLVWRIDELIADWKDKSRNGKEGVV